MREQKPVPLYPSQNKEQSDDKMGLSVGIKAGGVQINQPSRYSWRGIVGTHVSDPSEYVPTHHSAHNAPDEDAIESAVQKRVLKYLEGFAWFVESVGVHPAAVPRVSEECILRYLNPPDDAAGIRGPTVAVEV